MKIWTDIRDSSTIDPPERSILAQDTFLLDIETTGFTPKYQSIYLIGCAAIVQDQIQVTQYFAETPDEELAVIRAFADYIGVYRNVITFNGNRFDLPFLSARAEKLGIHLPIYGLNTIDLYRRVHDMKNLLHLPSYSQKSIEAYLGVTREDEYSGGELIDIYRRNAKCSTSSDEYLLMLHNHDDVLGMIPLMKMLRFEKLPKAGLRIESTSMEDNDWIIRASMDLVLPGEAHVHSDSYYMILKPDQIRLALPLYRGSLRYDLPNPKDYYYLPEEDIVIPKELGSSIDSSRRTRATKENCYVKSEGIFVPVPDNLRLPGQVHLFHEHYLSRQYYLKVPDATDQPAFIERWIRTLLQSLV